VDIVNIAARILLIEFNTVPTIPAARFGVVVASVTLAISNIRWLGNVTAGILLVEFNAIPTVPAARFGVGLSSVTRAISYSIWICIAEGIKFGDTATIAVGILLVELDAVSAIPSAAFGIIPPSMTLAISKPIVF